MSSPRSLPTTRYGERVVTRQLTDEQVETIRATYRKRSLERGAPALARRYGVNKYTIWKIATGRTYRYPSAPRRSLPVALNPDDDLATVDDAGIAQRVRHLRREHGWTQFDLGIACDTNRFLVSKWERGISRVSLPMLCRLADAFEVTLDHLVRNRS